MNSSEKFRYHIFFLVLGSFSEGVWRRRSHRGALLRASVAGVDSLLELVVAGHQRGSHHGLPCMKPDLVRKDAPAGVADEVIKMFQIHLR